MRTPVDVSLVGAARAGDRRATAELLAAHLPLIYNVVGRALDGHPDVDDVVQETMLRAFQGLKNLREPERFRSWLIAIAVRQIQERERVRRSARMRLTSWDDAPDPPDPGADVAEETARRPDLSTDRRTLRDAGRWLDAEDRRVLALYWQEVAGALTRAELADALGVSTAHAAVRIQRMRTRLTHARGVLAAWRHEDRCSHLELAARGWNGGPDPLWLKRLHRHVRDCAYCASAGRALPPTEWLLGAIGLLPLPAILAKAVPVAVGGAHAAAAAGGAHVPAALALQGLPLKKVAVGVAALVASLAAATVLIRPSTSDGERRIDAAPPPLVASSAVESGAPPATRPPERATTVHLAPHGRDDGDGSPERPYATLAKAVSVVAPGQTVVAHGGVYRATAPVEIRTSGTERQRITLVNAPGETPVFDAADVPADRWFVTHGADYWTVEGIEIRRARNHPYVCVACAHNVFRRLSIHDNRQTGLVLRDPGSTDNQVLDSDFYANVDDLGDGSSTADGLSVRNGAGTGNVIRGVRVYGNADDGLDLHEFADPVTVDRTWAFGNGAIGGKALVGAAGNGFRLGGGEPAPAVAHVVTNSAAWDNSGYGFTESANRGGLRLSRNTAYRNGKDGFAFFFSPATFDRNLALANGRDAVLNEGVAERGNSWNESGWTTTAFRSTDPRTAQSPRRPDGTLPESTFLVNRRDSGVGAPMTT